MRDNTTSDLQLLVRRLFVVAFAAFGFMWASFSLSAGAWFGVLGGVVILTGAFAYAVRPTAAIEQPILVQELPVLEPV